MDHLRRLGNSISIPITADEHGFTGRECPLPECKGYFKIEFGTGLKGEGLPCLCPYCGLVAGHDQFWTKDQIEYAESVAMRRITDAVHKDLKAFEFAHKPRGGFGTGISMKVKPGRQTPIRYYREKQLETEIVCADCTLRYSVYGVFAFCPDCGRHNSLQILDKNLEVVRKMLDLATGLEKALAEKLIENALEDCVSAFDGFGRELCRMQANKASNPAKAKKMTFQNLDAAAVGYQNLFGIDLTASVAPDEWRATVVAFQKRHLIAHKLGVVDQDYIAKSGDTRAVLGRKIGIDADAVRAIATIIGKLAPRMSVGLEQLERKP
ncbi:MAG TPA: hypothetical protein VJP77_03985 [Planctomycetota bacterium]|nr:hypothetical protein [Planctomycetota bacterium]